MSFEYSKPEQGAKMASAAREMLESDSEESELDSLTSAQSASTKSTARIKRIRYRFSCWTFQLIFNADITALNGGLASSNVTLQERQLENSCMNT